MRRHVGLILSLVMILGVIFSFTSCNRSYDEAEVKEAALSLIEATEDLNEIFWGEGIRYIKDASTANGAYFEADFIHLQEYGFTSVDEIKERTKEVFSENYSSIIFSTVFSSISDSEEIQFFARYYQKYSDKENKEPECIMVYSYAENLLPDEVTYHYDTIKVTHSEDEKVFVTVEATIKSGDKEQRRTKEIAFVEEEGGWRIDSPTYLKYSENYDKYEDLLDKNK